ncbi:MAG: electron transfer flavoprotein subunit beta/FixA family protein [Planctomycetota bacterium]|nr:electron transfer flavoprotein subunit beta/FixA family protein [Planctomycetota bacterium]
MNIVVPIKLVPDLAEELEINDDGNDVERDFLSYRINEFCDHAIEEALQLKEAHGGTVTVMALERDETDKVLYTALAKGADKVVKLTGVDEAAPTHAVARAFCQALGDMDYDLVLTGVQAADDRDGQLGVLLGSYLKVPHVSVVSAVEISDGTVRVSKEYAGGVVARFEVQPKAVLGIQAARETPRYAPVSRVRQIQKEATLDEFEADGVDLGTGTTVRRMFTPEQGEGATMFDGSTEDVAEKIVAVLNEKRGG